MGVLDKDTLDFLARRKDAARLDFFEARRQLEDFELEFGPQEDIGPRDKQYLKLSEELTRSYKAYKKAWVEWFAAFNDLPIHAPPGRKDTRIYGVKVPTRVRIERVMNNPRL